MNLQITFDESLPKEFHALSERALRTAIDFLDAQPRPKAKPEIQHYIPDWESIEFKIGADTWGRGLYQSSTMEGWAIITVRLSGDCVFDKPGAAIVVQDVDLELATAVGAVGMLDGLYYPTIKWDRQFYRQLEYVDSLAPTDGRAKSLLDQLDEQIKAEEEAKREAAYKNQFVVKHQQYRQRLKEARYIRTPSWFWAKNPDAIVSQHEAPETAPPPKPHYCKHEPQPPCPPMQPKEHPTPELSEFQKQQVAQTQAMLDYVQQNTITTDTFCTNPEPSTGACEDEDM